MLNKALFQELFAVLVRGMGINIRHKPMELLILDNAAAVMEAKLKQSMGALYLSDFKFPLFDFVVAHPDTGSVFKCSFSDPNNKDSVYGLTLFPGVDLLLVNTETSAVPVGGETNGEEHKSPKRQSGFVRRLDHDAIGLAEMEFVKSLYVASVNEVLAKSLPDYTRNNAKVFNEGDMVYRLPCSNKIAAIHQVRVTDIKHVTETGDVFDIGVFSIVDQHYYLDHSSKFGNEFEWISVNQKQSHPGHRPYNDFETATPDEMKYISEAIKRIDEILHS